MKSVAIVGTGLIGASFGLALRKAGFAGPIVGVSSPGAISEALAAGAIDRGLPLPEAVGQADLVYLSQTIGRILDTLRHLDEFLQPGTLVTDAGSTKCEIADVGRWNIQRGQFLGGHPMAGKEARGASAADPDLFVGRTWALTPDDRAELETPAARDFRAWLERIGARVMVVDAEMHDRMAAVYSHAPQLVSTALASAVSEQGERLPGLLCGPGLADMTRLALSSYELWRDILATNSEPIDHALAACIQKLEHVRENLRTRQLEDEFKRAAVMAAKIRGGTGPSPG